MLGTQDDFYSLCKPLIDDVESGTTTVVVSYLILLETIFTIERRITEKFPCVDDSAEKRLEIKEKIQTTIREFVRYIVKLSKEKKIIVPRSSKNITDHHKEVLEKMQNYFGYVRIRNECTICGKGTVKRNDQPKCPNCQHEIEKIQRYQYKGLGHADLEHAFLAKNSNSKKFFSSDKSFKDLVSDSSFSTIDFKIISN